MKFLLLILALILFVQVREIQSNVTNDIAAAEAAAGVATPDFGDLIPEDYRAKVGDSCPRTNFNTSDYLLLVLSNQVSFCRSKAGCDKNLVRNLFNNNVFFTIHGLWPQLVNPIDGHRWPQCCTDERFDVKKISSLRNYMETVAWPMVIPNDLWAHEWEKHGTCAVASTPKIPKINSQYDYFAYALNQFRDADASRRLISNGIRPSTTPVSVDKIRSVFKNALGGYPVITTASQGGTKFISEIWICINHNGSFIDCPATLRASYAKNSESVVIPDLSYLN